MYLTNQLALEQGNMPTPPRQQWGREVETEKRRKTKEVREEKDRGKSKGGSRKRKTQKDHP